MNKSAVQRTLLSFGLFCAVLAPQAASARYIGVRCTDGGFDIYTDAKYLVMRPGDDVPATLWEHTVISDDVFQGDRKNKAGDLIVLTIDRKTGLARFTANGVMKGGDRCGPRGAAPSVPPDAASGNAAGNKF